MEIHHGLLNTEVRIQVIFKPQTTEGQYCINKKISMNDLILYFFSKPMSLASLRHTELMHIV